MEKKQGFFSALEGVVRGLSPARSRAKSPAPRSQSPSAALLLLPRRRKGHIGGGHQQQALAQVPEAPLIARSASFRPVGEALAPLMEGPDGDAPEEGGGPRREGWGNWVRGQLSRAPSVTYSSSSSSAPAAANGSCSFRGSDLRLLLGVMGAPLAPIHVSTADPLPHLSIKDTPIVSLGLDPSLMLCSSVSSAKVAVLPCEMPFFHAVFLHINGASVPRHSRTPSFLRFETSSAQYILQQYTAASGGLKLQSSIRNAYAMGKVRMAASEFETATKVVKNRGGSTRATESGSFVLWQMAPDMWYVELAVGGSKVHAGSNGKLVWRHTPWLGAHAAKGPVRPLRRALQV
ncbi:hypothetical protein B296_00043378 [Ensete ventricosum]|uniref:Uncharacterized protein n=1 Tax=Ensete ventricosum TaxID=4639 RepID=A0A426XKU6_ENSVE|nr:hypothetical protein B296_00043378 [Ensete ventricosum]